jgi:site-specific recombinase XerD
MGVTHKTLEFYSDRLSQFTLKVDYIKTTPQGIQQYLNSIPSNHNGFATRHASFRAVKTFYRWLNAEAWP